MDIPFAYDKIASGKNILGREALISRIFETLTKSTKSVTLYGTMRSGKETVVSAVCDRIREAIPNLFVCEIDLFNVGSNRDFRSAFKKAMQNCLSGISSAALLPFDLDVDNVEEKKLFDLPRIIADETQTDIIIYFKDFQNILLTEEDGLSLDRLDKTWSRQQHVKYIFTGSGINMMKMLIEEKKHFYYMSTQFELEPLSRQTVCDYILGRFLKLGRVIEMAEALEIYNVTSGNMWYVNQLCAICYNRPIGYVNRKIVKQSTETLLSIHTPRFRQTLQDLTANQISFIRAVIEDVEKFSSAEIMEAYNFHSSANVFRVKDALKKKEVITFDRDDRAVIQDPLFEYWLRNYYFA